MHEDAARMAALSDALTALAAVAAPESRSETTSEALAEYFSEIDGRDAVSTADNRHYRLGQFDAAFGSVPLADLVPGDIGIFLAGFPSGSQHNVRTTIGPFFSWAARNGWPHAASVMPEGRSRAKSRDRWMCERELGEATRRLAWYERQPRSRRTTVDALRMTLTTGMRCGEIVTMTADELAPTCEYVYLRDTKTGDRRVPLGPVARSIVLRRRARATGARRYLFTGREGRGHMLRSSLSHAWRRLVDPIGLRDVRLHDVRHTWASMALRRGESLEMIRRVLGHTSKAMTAKYAHHADHDLVEIANRVEAQLLGCSDHQLELALPEESERFAVEKLTAAQRRLVCLPGQTVHPRGPGQAQAARALSRSGLFERLPDGPFVRTERGAQVREVLNG